MNKEIELIDEVLRLKDQLSNQKYEITKAVELLEDYPMPDEKDYLEALYLLKPLIGDKDD